MKLIMVKIIMMIMIRDLKFNKRMIEMNKIYRRMTLKKQKTNIKKQIKEQQL